MDRRIPPSASLLGTAMEAEWPDARPARDPACRRTCATADVRRDDIVVCAHGCGSLTDRVLDLALAARANVAVLPCCSDHSRLDGGGLDGWLDADLAIDVVRALRLRDEGYKVWTQRIPEDITPKNRLLLGRPKDTMRPGTRPSG